MFVAASDASAAEKASATFVCDGVADQAEIVAALSGTNQVELSTGTFCTTAGIIIPAGKTLFGQADYTSVLMAQLSTGKALTLGDGCELRDVKITSAGGVADAVGAVQTGSSNQLVRVWIARYPYGISTCDKQNVTIKDVRFAQIRDVWGWAACIHAAGTSNGIDIEGFTAEDCDRGIEVEDGAQNVTARNGTLTDVGHYDTYSFTLDAHRHNPGAMVANVLYENFVLTRCNGLTVAGPAADCRVSDITWRNIQIIDPILAGYNRALWISAADRVVVEGVTVAGCAPGKALVAIDSDVVIQGLRIL